MYDRLTIRPKGSENYFRDNLDHAVMMDIPVEWIIRIYGHLSPPDVLSFATTCRKHRSVWQQHTNTIYNLIHHTVQCKRDARTLLADQGVLLVDSPMTVAGFLQLRRNAHVMEKIIDKFADEFIVSFCVDTGIYLYLSSLETNISPPALTQVPKYLVGPPKYAFSGGGPRPPHLTPTERPRFIRVIYRIWGLFLLSSPEARRQRLERYVLKDLLSLSDIGPGYDPPPIDIITSVIMAEEKRASVIGLTIPKIDCSIYVDEILGKVLDAVDHATRYVYGCSREAFDEWDLGGWWDGPTSLVDVCRPLFKDVLINDEGAGAKRLVPVDEVWYDTSDGEIMDEVLDFVV